MFGIPRLNYLLILISLSFVRGGVFVPLGNWDLFKPTGKTITGFGTSKIMTSDGTGTDIDDATNCSWLTFNGGTWSLQVDYSALSDPLAEYAVGFWVKLQSTISTQIFLFGDATSNHYIISSTINGSLKVSFYLDATKTDSNNDFTFNVPLNTFTFLVFNFVNSAGATTLKILQPGTAKLSQTSIPNSSVPFAMPKGYLKFGKEITANFRKVMLVYTATISADYKIITLVNDNEYKDIAVPCTLGTCDDAACNSDGYCTSSYQYCTACTEDDCTNCDAPSAIDENNWCQACKDNYSLKNSRCCLTANNCATCAESTVCDSCDQGNFLYDVDSTTTTCISCTDSCTKCQPGPGCFKCAKSIVQVENTCRVDSVGYQISFNSPNIEIDFAHPLTNALSKNSFTATLENGNIIPTTSWSLTGCTVGSKKCLIGAPNIEESDLPIDIDLNFSKV